MTTIETNVATKPTIPDGLITINEKQYKWNLAAFRLDGKIISAEDASLDEEILNQIISIEGQGVLKEQF